MKVGPVRIIWIILALLAAFVIFVQCLAEVGGSPDAVPKPHLSPTLFSTPLTEQLPPANWLPAHL